jgi:demethylmenaquinone methyltransferase / 2-methoxy-6-polyprenyl-1,4-benzoquinol methylase
VALTLPAPDEKAAVVRAMFDRIAPRYERLNTLLTFGLDRGWRRATIAAAGIGPGSLVVDLACGTGDLAALAARAGAHVLGIDFARAMLARARGRGAALVQADAGALPLRDGRVDAVTCGFALRNVTCIPQVLAEAARVLRPGGRLVLLEVAEPRGALLRWGHRLYFHRIVPLLGAMLADREAYAYLPASTAYLPDPATLRAQLEAAGFATPQRRLLGGGSVQLVTAERDARAAAGRAA